MQQQSNPARGGWAKYGLLALLAAVGGAGGLYLSGGWPGTDHSEMRSHALRRATESETVHSQRFTLTAADAQDTMEAPALAVDAAGRAYLAWSSQTGPEQRTLWLARNPDASGHFEEPKVVAESGIFRSTSKWKDKSVTRDVKLLPHLAAQGDNLYLAWTESLPDNAGVRLVLAASTDAGQAFSPARCVHRGDKARAAFTALAAGDDGTLACSWLDNRRGVPLPFASIRRAGHEEFDEEQFVSLGQEGQGVCPCCPTAVCFGSDGVLYVAYRNVQDGFRDIALCLLRPGETSFEGPFPIVPNTWKFEGCPHDAPSLAIVGDTLHVAWMDAHTGQQRCYHGRAKLANLQFETQELHPGAAGTQGNAKLFADVNGGLHAVWEESLGVESADSGQHSHGPPKLGSSSGRAVWYAELKPGQKAFDRVSPIAPKPGAFQSRPSVARAATGERFAAWNELDESGKAVVVTRFDPTPLTTQGGQP